MAKAAPPRTSTDEPHADVRAALAAVPRGRFLGDDLSHLELAEAHVPMPEGHSMPPREVVGRMIEALDLRPGARVLEVGTGSGYAAAILSRLAERVFTVERVPSLALLARNRLRAIGADNVLVRRGDGCDGWAEQAPFDAVLVSACAAEPGETLLHQLAVGGRLVMPTGPYRAHQRLVRITRRSEDDFEREDLGEVRFVSLLGDILVDLGAAERDDVEKAASVARSTGAPIGDVLQADDVVEETDLYRALAVQHGLELISLADLVQRADLELVRTISRAFAEHNRIIPVRRGDDHLVLATCSPEANVFELAQAFGVSAVELFVVTPTDFRRFWTVVDVGGAETLRSATPASEEADLLTSPVKRLDAHAVALLDALLLDAIGERASDIHLEVFADDVRVRLRVDGQLQDLTRFRLSRPDLVALINVLKVCAGLDIAEKRRPQGGRFRRRAGEDHFDLRLQTQPTLFGEQAVLRLLREEAHHLAIEELGFSSDMAAAYRRLLNTPQGLVLVVGPTGCGKTTTLYAGLQILAGDESRKVITVEDPIEYAIPGVQQSQVNAGIGFVFSSAMRSFVRQDPDVILVGEIRDGETAMEAIRASQTGHLVLSTLHCNDAVDSVQRLYDLGMHPNSIASELLAVIAQRLGRRNCEACREDAPLEEHLAAEVFPDGVPEGFGAKRGRGCPRCGERGTRGRIAVAELLRTDEMFRSAISRQPPVDELRRLAREAGVADLRDAALAHVASGEMPFSELPRLLTAEQLSPWERRARTRR